MQFDNFEKKRRRWIVPVAVGVCGLGIWNLQPSEGTPGVGGKRGPTSIEVGVLGHDTRECGISVLPANPLSIVVGSTLQVIPLNNSKSQEIHVRLRWRYHISLFKTRVRLFLNDKFLALKSVQILYLLRWRYWHEIRFLYTGSRYCRSARTSGCTQLLLLLCHWL